MGTFKDSLKKWFYTQGTQAASASARIPLLDASGNPIGSDTMANLASVLGVPFIKEVAITDLNSDDCIGDNIVSTFQTNTASNLPADVGSNLYGLYVCFSSYVFNLQILFVSNNSMYIRFIWGGDYTRPWKKVTLT